MRFTEKKILTNGDMSQATLASKGMQIQQGVNWSIQAVWTGGTADGVLTIEVSNDIVPVNPDSSGDPAINVVNWSTYTGSNTNVSGAGDFAWLAQNAGYQWVRLKFVKNSGTGVLNATFNGKGP